MDKAGVVLSRSSSWEKKTHNKKIREIEQQRYSHQHQDRNFYSEKENRKRSILERMKSFAVDDNNDAMDLVGSPFKVKGRNKKEKKDKKKKKDKEFVQKLMMNSLVSREEFAFKSLPSSPANIRSKAVISNQ